MLRAYNPHGEIQGGSTARYTIFKLSHRPGNCAGSGLVVDRLRRSHHSSRIPTFAQGPCLAKSIVEPNMAEAAR